MSFFLLFLEAGQAHEEADNAADAADWPVMGDRDLSGYEPSRLFLQLPPDAARRAGPTTPRFVDGAAAAGITDLANGRGVAVVDVDNDGLLDLYVANQGTASMLYHNRPLAGTAPRHWFGLALRGSPDAPQDVGGRRLASTTFAVGARVELEAGGRRQVREVSGGTGFSSQSEHRLHFGLGAAIPDMMTVRWPSGRVQRFEGAPLRACLDGYSLLVEGASLEPHQAAGFPVAANAGQR